MNPEEQFMRQAAEMLFWIGIAISILIAAIVNALGGDSDSKR